MDGGGETAKLEVSELLIFFGVVRGAILLGGCDFKVLKTW